MKILNRQRSNKKYTTINILVPQISWWHRFSYSRFPAFSILSIILWLSLFHFFFLLLIKCKKGKNVGKGGKCYNSNGSTRCICLFCLQCGLLVICMVIFLLIARGCPGHQEAGFHHLQVYMWTLPLYITILRYFFPYLLYLL